MNKYKITLAYDGEAPHWSMQYSDELLAHKEFAKFLDWGFADVRRSNAAQPVRNKKKYTRKIKHKNKLDN